jgi:two-component system OmpR family response regulator
MFPGAPSRVLLVADSPRAPREALAGVADRVVTASDAATGFARYREGNVDCVVTARGLPDADGLGLLRAIRAEDERTPVVVYDEADDADLALTVASLGAAYHRTDPGEGFDRLVSTVERTVASGERAAAGEEGFPVVHGES